jgi:phage terminase large subunit-like protein
MTTRTPSKAVQRRLPPCGYALDGTTCRKVGDHHCAPRVTHVVKFFAEVLVHTKARWARKAFALALWQKRDIVAPLFGTIRWDPESETYVRRYRIAWIELGRKNGKSELLAGIMLFLLVADGEEGAELYGCAKDRDQASIVYEVARRMVELSPILSQRLTIYKQGKRIVDERTGSFYQVIAADASGNLGQNPHGIAFDEVITQPNGDLWSALRTGFGARTQPLMVGVTTPGDDDSSFAKAEHDEMIRIAEDPSRNPHTFVYIRNVPADADPWNERNWKLGNPALGDFLSLQVLREEAVEAKNDRTKENKFRQFRLSQWVQQTTRWLSIAEWNDNIGDLGIAPEPDWLAPQLEGRKCWAGLDLSSKLDLTAWSLLFEDGTVIWRYWAPESVVPLLDKHTAGKFSLWCDAGWVTLTDGNTIDYDLIYSAIEIDHARYSIAGIVYDRWSGEPVRQEIQKRTGLEMNESATTFDRMTLPMKELSRLLKSQELAHGGNPVSTWMADSLEAKSPRDDGDRVRPVKPDRGKTGKRIDGMVTLLMSIDGRLAVLEAEEPPKDPFFIYGEG